MVDVKGKRPEAEVIGAELPSARAVDVPDAVAGALILVVEDDPLVSDVLQEVLKDAGYEIAAASSGAEALLSMQTARPDLILLDLTLPDIDGIELCRQLRADRRWDAVPIIALTARGQLSDRIVGLREGLDDYLTKPFSISELAARLDANLRRSQRELHTSPLTLLPGNRAIEVSLAARLASGRSLAVCYLDFNNIKPYNDCYGFTAGDAMIRGLADIIQEAISGSRDGFPGHIGGDDFIVILDPDEAEPFCKRVLSEFALLLPSLYSAEDLARGAIQSEDRAGAMRTFPLVGLSIAVVVQDGDRYSHVGELSRAAAEIKSYLKQQGGSHYLIDRRGT